MLAAAPGQVVSHSQSSDTQRSQLGEEQEFIPLVSEDPVEGEEGSLSWGSEPVEEPEYRPLVSDEPAVSGGVCSAKKAGDDVHPPLPDAGEEGNEGSQGQQVHEQTEEGEWQFSTPHTRREWAIYRSWGLEGRPEVWKGAPPYPPAPPGWGDDDTIPLRKWSQAHERLWENMMKSAEARVEESRDPPSFGRAEDEPDWNKALDIRVRRLTRILNIRAEAYELFRNEWGFSTIYHNCAWQRWYDRREGVLEERASMEEQEWCQHEHSRRRATSREEVREFLSTRHHEAGAQSRAREESGQAGPSAGQQAEGGAEQMRLPGPPPPTAEGSGMVWLGASPEEALRALHERTASRDRVHLVPWRRWTPQLQEKVTSRVEEAATARRQQSYQRLRESWHPSPLWPTEAAFKHWVEEQEDRFMAEGWCYNPPGLDPYPELNIPRPLGSEPGDSGSDGEGRVRYYVGMLAPRAEQPPPPPLRSEEELPPHLQQQEAAAESRGECSNTRPRWPVHLQNHERWTADQVERRTERVYCKAAERRMREYAAFRGGSGAWGKGTFWPDQAGFEQWVRLREEDERRGIWCPQSPHFGPHPNSYCGRPSGSTWGDSDNEGDSHYHYVGVLTPVSTGASTSEASTSAAMATVPLEAPELTRPLKKASGGEVSFPLFTSRQHKSEWEERMEAKLAAAKVEAEPGKEEEVARGLQEFCRHHVRVRRTRAPAVPVVKEPDSDDAPSVAGADVIRAVVVEAEVCIQRADEAMGGERAPREDTAPPEGETQPTVPEVPGQPGASAACGGISGYDPLDTVGVPQGHLYIPRTGVTGFLPTGMVLTPAAERFNTDPETLAHIGKHPATTAEQQEQVRDLVREFRGRSFAYSLNDLPGYSGKAGPFEITMLTDKTSFQNPRPQSQLQQKIRDAKCQEMLEGGVIVPAPQATSAACPTFAAKKAPDGTWSDTRFCIDYKQQNLLSAPQHTRYPVAEDLFQSLGDSKFFSKIDLRAGYFQLPIHADSHDFTAFWWGTSLYKYVRVPFGLKHAPAALQRVMDLELGGAGCSGFTKTFIDDILVHSATFEEHLQHLRAVFTVLHKCGLRAHPEKTQLLIDTIDFLGYDVSAFGMTPQEVKIKAIKDLDWPRDVPELRTKLGILQYYSCFCPNFSARAKPLTQLLKKNQPWEWEPKIQGKAFDDVRDEICTPGKGLRRFDPERPIFVHTDFSNRGLGAVLAQVDADGNEYIVACVSRSTNKHEANYSSYKGECLAAVWACKLFQHYTGGLHFTLVTDHEPLKWLMTTTTLQGTHARWACQLQEYSFTIAHRAGASHQNADALSRYPQASTQDQTGARMDHDEDPRQLIASLGLPVTPHEWRIRGYYHSMSFGLAGAQDRFGWEPPSNGVRDTTVLDRHCYGTSGERWMLLESFCMSRVGGCARGWRRCCATVSRCTSTSTVTSAGRRSRWPGSESSRYSRRTQHSFPRQQWRRPSRPCQWMRTR